MFHASRLAPPAYRLRLPRLDAFRAASRTSPVNTHYAAHPGVWCRRTWLPGGFARVLARRHCSAAPGCFVVVSFWAGYAWRCSATAWALGAGPAWRWALGLPGAGRWAYLALGAGPTWRWALGLPGAGRWAYLALGAVRIGWPGREGARQGGRPGSRGSGGGAEGAGVSSSLSRTPQTPNFPSYYIFTSGSAQRLPTRD